MDNAYRHDRRFRTVASDWTLGKQETDLAEAPTDPAILVADTAADRVVCLTMYCDLVYGVIGGIVFAGFLMAAASMAAAILGGP